MALPVNQASAMRTNCQAPGQPQSRRLQVSREIDVPRRPTALSSGIQSTDSVSTVPVTHRLLFTDGLSCVPRPSRSFYTDSKSMRALPSTSYFTDSKSCVPCLRELLLLTVRHDTQKDAGGSRRLRRFSPWRLLLDSQGSRETRRW